MKKKLFVLFILVSATISQSLAQEKPFLFGMKLSPNIGWMKPNSDGYNYDGVKSGISWGLVAEIHLMENYDLHSGVNITMIRSALTYPDLKTIEGNPIEGEMSRLYNFKYLGLPLIFRMKTNENTKKRFFGQVGLELNFLLSGNAKDKFLSENAGQINEENDIYKEIKFARYAVIVGAGMEYALGGSNKLITGINFNNGINDILKDENKINPSINQIAINNYFEIYVSFLF
ncbi:MAG: PorT family protein [Bacteroidetes bacterium]|nr:PorT family protein [Bacteroidota bacterium]